MKIKIHIMTIMAFAAMVYIVQTTIAGDAYWKAGVSGDWSDDSNWDVVPAANDSIFINGDGTYTSVWHSSNLETTFSNITVGVSASGSQTLKLTGPGWKSLNIIGGITVGANGLVEQDSSFSDTAPDSYQNIHLIDGSVWRLTNTDDRAAYTGRRRAFVVEAGGTVDIPENILCTTRTDTSTNIFNGLLTGGGTFNVAGGGTVRIAGTGVVDVAKITIPSNGHLYFYSTGLVVSSKIFADRDAVLYCPGPGETVFNGDILYTNSPNIIIRSTTGSERNITGAGDVVVSCGKNLSFLGFHHDSPGKLYLAGTGRLLVNMNGYIGNFYGSLDLGRESVISNGVFLLSSGKKVCINVTNETGNVLMKDFSLIAPCGNNGNSTPTSVKISDNGTITFEGLDITTAVHRNNLDLMNIEVSVGNSGGNLNFASGSENSIKLDIDSGSSDYRGDYWQVRLNSNSLVTAASDATLLLENGRFMSEISQGWQFDGTLIIGTNMTMTALSKDSGASFNRVLEPNYTGTLKILEEADVFTLNEFVISGTESQTCLYVGTLDFSDIPSDSEPLLDGCDGDAKVYYLNLINPNNVVFDDTKWVLASETLAGTVILIQ